VATILVIFRVYNVYFLTQFCDWDLTTAPRLRHLRQKGSCVNCVRCVGQTLAV